MKTTIVIAIIVGLLSATWLGIAYKSGAFIPHDARYAVEPGEFTPDAMATHKQLIDLGAHQVAYIEMGEGDPLLLLHRCPFSVFEWNAVAPALAQRFRVIAPDLLGLGDTPVRLNGDYRLPQEVKMVTGVMDRLGIRSARFIGHDHGGAIVQLLMQHDPARIDMAILTNTESYDQWPSGPEKADLHLITNPLTSPFMYLAMQSRWVQRELYSIAVVNQATLTDEMLDSFAQEHLSTALRWQRLRRFFAWQLDPVHNHLTMEVVPAMRQFTRPVLILWGEQDTNFGPAIGKRLARDIPGTKGIAWMTDSAHLPMLEQPQVYSSHAVRFLIDGTVNSDEQAGLELARR